MTKEELLEVCDISGYIDPARAERVLAYKYGGYASYTRASTYSLQSVEDHINLHYEALSELHEVVND
jgi:hypothetical protein